MSAFDRTALIDALKDHLRTADDEAASYVEEALHRLQEQAVPDFPAVEAEETLARRIDHTQLKAEATEAQIHALCDEAREHHFATVCVNPCYVPLAASRLCDAPVDVCTVAGFPLGAARSTTKAHEARQAIEDGAAEVDMVQAVGMLKDGRYTEVERDVQAVVEAARGTSGGQAVVKVILETCLLTDVEKALACVLALRAGADFVKTSTGFSTGGATPGDVALMRQVVGVDLGVKASGGIRNYKDAREMIARGATRIGASGSVAILKGAPARTDY